MTEIIQSALAAVKSQVEKVKAEHAQTLEQIGKIKAEIKRLQDMPVCREDFAVLLKESIAANAAAYTDGFCETLLKDIPNTDIKGIQTQSFSRLEAYVGNWIFHGEISRHDMLIGLDNSPAIRRALCWLFPEVIHEKIMTLINAEIGEKWGNDELPRIAERRETIADLTAELESLQARKAELEAALAEFSRLS